MSSNKKLDAFEELNKFTGAHYDAIAKRWYNNVSDEGIKNYCNEEETKAFQKKRRELKFAIQMMDDAEKLKGVISNEQALEYKKFMPLVSRRVHPDKWKFVGKTLQDGNIFTFRPVQLTESVHCGCDTEQLKKEIEIANGVEKGNAQWFWAARLDNEHITMIKDRQALHNKMLAEGQYDKETLFSLYCSHPVRESNEVFQNKHTIGNWNCQACLNVGQEIEDANSASSAMAAGKALEWCPRFITMLRNIPILVYLEMTKAHDHVTTLENKVCYAGLLHSEISFEEEEIETNPDKGISEIKRYVVVTKKCDTCSYEEVIRKEYFQPEEIRSNELLVNLNGDKSDKV